jgi:prepilin-type N-terminal cleavage/methylation domain-containing protein
MKKGFTLLELLVVIAIIGILSSVIMVSLGNAKIKARDARRLHDISQIQLALELYYDKNGSYPATGTGGWIHSSEAGWSTLATSMGVTLPTDPINETLPWANDQSRNWSGDSTKKLNYDYLSGSNQNGCTAGKFYWLVYRLEKGDTPAGSSPGVFMCDSTTYKAINGAVTVGTVQN